MLSYFFTKKRNATYTVDARATIIIIYIVFRGARPLGAVNARKRRRPRSRTDHNVLLRDALDTADTRDRRT